MEVKCFRRNKKFVLDNMKFKQEVLKPKFSKFVFDPNAIAPRSSEMTHEGKEFRETSYHSFRKIVNSK